MLSLGSGIFPRSLRGWLTLGTLSAIVFLILRYLLKPIMLNRETASTVHSLLINAGLNTIIAGYAVAQSAHETNGFNSRLLTDNNNAFGMKYAKQAIAKGEKNGYANYNNLNDSITDFVRWYGINRNKLLSLPLVIDSLPKYVNFLKRYNYFEDTEKNYLRGVEYYHNLLNE